jgi:hypothetical protein
VNGSRTSIETVVPMTCSTRTWRATVVDGSPTATGQIPALSSAAWSDCAYASLV